MGFFSSSWVRYTKPDDLELFYAAQQMSYAMLDKSYRALSANKVNYAASYFAGNIRQTNDLEAHFGFIYTNLIRQNRIDRLTKTYDAINIYSQPGKTGNYVKALRIFLSQPSEENIKEAISLLEEMPWNHFNPAIRYQLIGYGWHLRLKNSVNGFNFNKNYANAAHHNYLMALDLGSDNIRIRSAVLTNMGLLHQITRTWDQSTNYLEKRNRLPFLNSDEETSFRWIYARTLFNSHRYMEAYLQAQKGLDKLESNPTTVMGFTEKTAFYALYAGRYKKAANYYLTVLSSNEIEGINLLKLNLGLGYTYIKAKNNILARKFLKLVYNKSQITPPTPAHLGQLPIHPLRQGIIAAGLLSNIATSNDLKNKWRQRRIALLKKLENKEKASGLREESRLEFMTKDYNQIANNYFRDKNYRKAYDNMIKAIDSAILWSNETDETTGKVAYQALVNYYVMAIKNRQLFWFNENQNVISEMGSDMITTFEKPSLFQSIETWHYAKINVLKTTFEAIKSKSSNSSLKNRLSKIMQKKKLLKMKKSEPQRYNELKSLVTVSIAKIKR